MVVVCEIDVWGYVWANARGDELVLDELAWTKIRKVRLEIRNMCEMISK